MAWSWGGAAKGAAAGSAVAPGLGTIAGGIAGGFMGNDGDVPQPMGQYKPPELERGQQFTPGTYKGQFDPRQGGQQYQGLEQQMGIQGFDRQGFQDAQMGALRSNAMAQLGQQQRGVDQAGMGAGLGGSGMNRALNQLAGSEADRTVALGAANIAGQTAQLGAQEDARRMGGALGIAGQNLQNRQFGAGFDAQQRQFGAGFNEQQRQFDQGALQGQYQDQYMMNEVLPAQRADQRRAGNQAFLGQIGQGLMSAGGQLGGALL